MENTNEVTWKIPAWRGQWQYDRFNTDKKNIDLALAQMKVLDEKLPEKYEIEKVNEQLDLPQTPDDLSKSITQRAAVLCNAIDFAPIEFRAKMSYRNDDATEGATSLFLLKNSLVGYKDHSTKAWASFSTNGVEIIRQLNALPKEKRQDVKLKFRVEFGNSSEGLGWSEACWMETIMHEIGIHVAQMLHSIEKWREGGIWSSSDLTGELDHYLFRYRGYKRYLLWLNRVAPENQVEMKKNVQDWEKKIPKDKNNGDLGSELVAKLLFAATNLKQAEQTEKEEQEKEEDEAYTLDACLMLAMHFPPVTGKLVCRDNSQALDLIQSKEYIMSLKTEVKKIFASSDGGLKGQNVAYYWWK